MSAPPRIIIADDHVLVGEGVRRILQGEFEIVDIVTDGAALVESTRRHNPDAIITDLTMPRLSGLEAIRLLRKLGQAVPAVVMTMHSDPFLANAAIAAGASGYVLKHAATDELILAIREVLAGRQYISARVEEAANEPAEKLPQSEDTGPALTPRQQEVLKLIAQGTPIKQIATRLHISRRTVEAHKYHLMRILEVHNVAELVRHAIRRGLISVHAHADH